MAKTKKKFRREKQIALANYEESELFTIEERMKKAEEAKRLVDNSYSEVFGGEPLPFPLVEEIEEEKVGRFSWRSPIIDKYLILELEFLPYCLKLFFPFFYLFLF